MIMEILHLCFIVIIIFQWLGSSHSWSNSFIVGGKTLPLRKHNQHGDINSQTRKISVMPNGISSKLTKNVENSLQRLYAQPLRIRKLYYPHGPMKRSSNVSATWILLAVNTLIFVLGQKFPVVITLMQRNTRYLIDKYWFLKLGFFGSQFAHRDFTHFVSNMMSLYNIAPSVSRKMHLGFCLID